ncbi:MAG TPA: hypothetical protein PLX95_00640 [bacterium]|nr:hypothetical protein [bacterium]
MKTSKLILLFMVFVLLLNGCGYVVGGSSVKSSKQPSVVSTNTLIPTFPPTFKPTSTPTLVPTSTPIPSPTPTLTPTPTAIPTPVFTSIENDLSPSFAQSISTEYMGVKFNLELITDSSLNPEITKIKLNEGFEDTLAAVVARVFFEIWWAKGPVQHNFDPHTFDLGEVDDEFNSFMSLWALAQETNNFEDWEKVQINRVYANNLNDGNGYQMNPHNFWIMYDGEPPEGITGVGTYSVAFVDTTEVDNLQISWVSSYSGEFLTGYGMNIDNDRLIVYLGFTDFRMGEVRNGCGLSCVPATFTLRFVPMTIMSSVNVGIKKFFSNTDMDLTYNLRDNLIVIPVTYP